MQVRVFTNITKKMELQQRFVSFIDYYNEYPRRFKFFVNTTNSQSINNL